MQRKLYRIAIDDSGDREYAPGGLYAAPGHGPSRFFVYGGVIGDVASLQALERDLQALKRSVFHTADVEVKSHWLRRADQRRKRYLDPFGLTDAQLDAFVEAYYRTVVGSQVTLIASVVDKAHMQQAYTTPWPAATAAYEILIQRAVQHVPCDAQLAVRMDIVDGAAHRTQRAYSEMITRHHQLLRQRGSTIGPRLKCDRLTETVRFEDSAKSDLVQVADLVAYAVHRQFRDHGAEWESRGAKHLPLYPYFKAFLPRFRTGPDRRIQGYGIVKMPMLTRVRWVLK